MPRAAHEVIAACEQYHASGYAEGECLAFVQDAFGTPHAYASAIDQWNNGIRRMIVPPPSGVVVPMFWEGGSHGFGHVAVWIGDGSGCVWSTDLVAPGHVDRVDWRTIESHWGETPLGYTLDLAGERVDVAWTVHQWAVRDETAGGVVGYGTAYPSRRYSLFFRDV